MCHWFDRAGRLVGDGEIARVGLVATNSIRGGRNRPVLDRITQHGVVFDAWSDEPWVIDGAAVRVSLICFSGADAKLQPEIQLNGQRVDQIFSDLTARSGGKGIDLTRAQRLRVNLGTAFMGDTKGGSFDIPGDLARGWLRLPANPNGRPNADVLKPWVNGKDVTRRQADKWIVEFDSSENEVDAALYEAPFVHVAEHVKPVRQSRRSKVPWWQHERPRPAMWGLSTACPVTSPHQQLRNTGSLCGSMHAFVPTIS